MIFYVIKDKKIRIADLSKKIEYEKDLNDPFVERLIQKSNKHWITWERDYSVNIPSYFLKDYKDKSLQYYKNSLGIQDDLEVIIAIFSQKLDVYRCKMHLIKEFKLPEYFVNRTIASITERIIEAKPVKNSGMNYKILPVVHLHKYKFTKEFFNRNRTSNSKLVVNIAGVEHKYGMAGLHGARRNFHKKGRILYIDAKMFYPTIMHTFGIGFDGINKEKASYIHSQNKFSENRLPYKLADNSIVGNFKNPNSNVYNPVANTTICVNGQLLITMLIEMLEPGIELIQTNTDGIIVSVKNEDHIFITTNAFTMKTGIELSITEFDEIYQKDVNNYILRKGNDFKTVGVFAVPSQLKYSQAIVPKAILEYLRSGRSIEKTIFNCDDRREFQILVDDKVVYASKKGNYLTNEHGKIAGVPRCSEDFDNIDKNWYIEEAYKWLKSTVK